MSKWTTVFSLSARDRAPDDWGRTDFLGRTASLGFPARFDATAIRVTLSNRENPNPYPIGLVRIHLPTADGGAKILNLSFPAAMIPAHGTLTSNPYTADIHAGDTLGIRITCLDEPTDMSSIYPARLDNGVDSECVPLLASVDLLTDDDRRAIVMFGDSITQMRLWTDHAADRAAALSDEVCVLNAGIGGNRLLRDTNFAGSSAQFFGRSALERFKQDVAALHGVSRVFVALGINDISQPQPNPMHPPMSERCTADELKRGFDELKALIEGIGAEPVFCTITPFGGLASYDAESEAIRLAANEYARTLGACVDFSAAVEDASKPGWLKPEYDSGDNLHPSPAGGKAMADAIPDELLK